MTFETWVALAQLVIVPFVGWLLRNSFGRVTDRIGRLESRTDKTEAELDQKQDREDFIRETARMRNALEKLLEGQAKIEGMIGADTRTAAALERMVDANKKHEAE